MSEGLESLEGKLRVVRDRVEGIVHGHHSGVYIYGAGGLGKSHTVLGCLDELKADYRLFNSRMTAKGLCLALAGSPDAVHVLEDMERITKDADAQGVLRSALWAQPGKRRVVTWTTAKENIKFEFRGGIIMIANVPLAEMAELKALATRITTLKLEVSDAELTDLMRDLAAKGKGCGKGQLGPDVCLTVCEYVIDQCRAAGCPLDMRLYVNALADYQQYQAGHSRIGWRELVANRVRQSANHRVEEAAVRTREDKKEAKRSAFRAIRDELQNMPDGAEKTAEMVRRFKARGGGAPATYYRYKSDVEAEDLLRKPESNNGEI
jgi:hypothetical protein